MSSTSSATKAVSFRIPVDLKSFLETVAADSGVTVTTIVIAILDHYRTYYDLPFSSVHLLESDRVALKLGRLSYFQFLLHRRVEAVRKRGPGFDAEAP